MPGSYLKSVLQTSGQRVAAGARVCSSFLKCYKTQDEVNFISPEVLC